MLNFKFVEEIKCDEGVCSYTFRVFREMTTDTIWIRQGQSLVQMFDPITGKPLTYKGWLDKYTI